MKKTVLLMGLVAMMSCGNQGNDNDDRSDSTNAMDESNVPMYGDTTKQINNNAGPYAADTSNMNGDDSVKGSPSSSRRTAPGNEKGDKKNQ